MITSPAYFNSLKWDVRRKTLIDIAGKIDIPEFDIENPELKKREIQGAKKRLKDEIDSIQPAITALKTQIIEANWAEIEAQLEQQNAALSEIDTAIESQSLAYESQRQAQSEIREKKRKLENELAELRAANRAEYNQKRLAIDAEKAQAERNIVSYNRELAQLYEQLKRQESQLAANETKVQETRNRWKTLNATVAPEYSGQTECPSCNQTLPAAKIQELKNTFIAKWNNKKIADLNEIAEEGKGAKGNIEFLQKEIEVTKSRIYEIEKAIDAIRSVEYTMPTMPIDTPDELALVDEINSIVIPEIKVPEITELKAQKSAITMAIHELHRQLNQRDANDRLNAAIKEKTAKLKSMNQELAQLEKTEFRIKQYEHQMMSAVESAVNGMFTMVKWRMFKTQINGELDPDCECLINGVPYSDANTASQINAGLDIINTLCKHYGYSAPIFIDRRESVTTLIPTDNQIINLVVPSITNKKSELKLF
jgi:chromosome segregation ATPase